MNQAGYIQTYGNYDVAALSGGLVKGTYGTAEKGNFGNAVPGVCGLTPGFWGQHLWAWDGLTDNPNDGPLDGQGRSLGSKLVADKVLYQIDALNPMSYGSYGKGVLVGDVNRNGKTDVDLSDPSKSESTIFFKLADAQNLINASTNLINSDQRSKMARDAIATQLNLQNGATADTAVKDLLTGAALWLTGKAPYGGFSPSGNVDQGSNGTGGGDGIADIRYTSKAFDGFYGSVIRANSPAWQVERDWKAQKLSGSEIHETLDDFNNCYISTGIDKPTGRTWVAALAGDGNDSNYQDDRAVGLGSLTNFNQFMTVSNLV